MEDGIVHDGLNNEMTRLVEVFGATSAQKYVEIDSNLMTERSSEELDSDVARRVDNEESDEEEQCEEQVISSFEANDYIKKLKNYFMHHKNTNEFEIVADLQMSFEDLESKKRKNKPLSEITINKAQ